MALRKLVYENQVTIIPAENLNAIQDAIIALEDGLFTMDAAKSGDVITMTDASNRGFRSLNIYGKTTQNGTPTPDAPVDLVSVGDSGSIMVSVTGENKVQKMIISTPKGLPGIPVTSGGNYKDANGQQWVCDEIDFARGVYVQRIKKHILDGTQRILLQATSTEKIRFDIDSISGTPGGAAMCDSLVCSVSQALNTMHLHGGSGKPVLFVNVANNVDDFKTYLSEHPFTVLMQITPIETPLTDAEISAFSALHTYKDHTEVSNDAGGWMELEYVMDAKKYIDSKISSTILAATVE